MENINFWKNKKVVVTGGAGFLGSFVVEKLRERNCHNIFIPRREEYNLVEIEDIKRLYKGCKPNIVIHLAAKVGGIWANRQNPGSFFYENLMMGIQMIEVGRQFGIEKFVTLATICSYPKFTPVPFKEDALWNGYPEETNAPYGLAKKMLLVQSQAYRQQYGFNSIVLFPVNLYGPRDNFNLETSHVIPALIKKCFDAINMGKDEIEVWGTGNPTREFLYVEDCAEAIILAAEKYNKSEPVNIGAGFEISIKNMVHLICRLTGFKGKIIWDNGKPNGQPRRCLDVSRALREFGFKAKIDLETGLRLTIKWYKETYLKEKLIQECAL